MSALKRASLTILIGIAALPANAAPDPVTLTELDCAVTVQAVTLGAEHGDVEEFNRIARLRLRWRASEGLFASYPTVLTLRSPYQLRFRSAFVTPSPDPARAHEIHFIARLEKSGAAYGLPKILGAARSAGTLRSVEGESLARARIHNIEPEQALADRPELDRPESSHADFLNLYVELARRGVLPPFFVESLAIACTLPEPAGSSPSPRQISAASH